MERSWFGWRKAKKGGRGGGGGGEKEVVVDGSGIRELVADTEAFGMFADTKFAQLDADGDGRLSARELEPAVADIGATLGLPAQGSSPNADHIYSEVRTHGHAAALLHTRSSTVLIRASLCQVPAMNWYLMGQSMLTY
jgi:hypothetical protein